MKDRTFSEWIREVDVTEDRTFSEWIREVDVTELFDDMERLCLELLW